ncbi:hypothetical protein TRICHSKD4_3598 [Roseibium sp. TrichSKD4]|nr:hypothetical protein TRICHSKD4_3598 [Roseibium sp. TrichSKD4]
MQGEMQRLWCVKTYAFADVELKKISACPIIETSGQIDGQ